MKMRYVIPGFPVVLRYVLFAAAAAGGVAYQFFARDANVFIGFLIIACGIPFILAKGYWNKPKDIGQEDWRPSTIKEFDRIKENLAATKQTRFPFYFNPGLGFGLILILVFASFILFVFVEYEDMMLLVAFVDCALILVPVLMTGSIRLWTPFELSLKMNRFRVVLDAVEQLKTGLVITPYLRLDKDAEGRQIPEDIRLLIEPRRKPDDFIGVQVQVAINNGPNGMVPYMYAVFLCNGKGRSFDFFSKQDFGKSLSEPGGDGEYGYVVVRQPTGGGGYHTTDADCIGLVTIILSALRTMPVS